MSETDIVRNYIESLPDESDPEGWDDVE